MVNLERLNAVMDYIEAHPEEHDQDSLGIKTKCGTTMCFAGLAVYLYAPDKIVWHGNFMTTSHL